MISSVLTVKRGGTKGKESHRRFSCFSTTAMRTICKKKRQKGKKRSTIIARCCDIFGQSSPSDNDVKPNFANTSRAQSCLFLSHAIYCLFSFLPPFFWGGGVAIFPLRPASKRETISKRKLVGEKMKQKGKKNCSYVL